MLTKFPTLNKDLSASGRVCGSGVPSPRKSHLGLIRKDLPIASHCSSGGNLVPSKYVRIVDSGTPTRRAASALLFMPLSLSAQSRRFAIVSKDASVPKSVTTTAYTQKPLHVH